MLHDQVFSYYIWNLITWVTDIELGRSELGEVFKEQASV